MKELLVMRHAKSSWNNVSLTDYQRPLNKRGKIDAQNMGRLLKQLDLTPQLILCSTAERALTTAEFVAISSDYEADLQLCEQFYLAEPETYLTELRRVNDQYGRVLVIGHNPGMEELVEMLSGQLTHFTTANIAHIRLPIDNWSSFTEEITGTILNLWRPKEIL